VKTDVNACPPGHCRRIAFGNLAEHCVARNSYASESGKHNLLGHCGQPVTSYSPITAVNYGPHTIAPQAVVSR
jgi:hypothetical protein